MLSQEFIFLFWSGATSGAALCAQQVECSGAQEAAAGLKDQGRIWEFNTKAVSRDLLVEACEGHSETSFSPQVEDVSEQLCGLDTLLRGKEQDQKTQRDH